MLVEGPKSHPAAVAELPHRAQQEELHLLILETRARDRSRLREALWLSVIFHLVVLLALILLPQYLPEPARVLLATPADEIRDRELTFLELPSNDPVAEKQPDTNIISDKNRIASSRAPQIDRKTLDELRDSSLPGPPKPPGPQESARASASPPEGSEPPRTDAGIKAPPTAGERAKLETSPQRPGEGGFVLPDPRSVSPGRAIEEAARASVDRRGGYGGASGEFGLGRGSSAATVGSNIDILSDTMGVDFGPYLARILHDVRINWFNLIPEVARAPMRKQGKVAIQFAILKDGSVAGMRLMQPSGDVSLDRAAWGGITASNPFPPLPEEFRGKFLALRFHFYYNPDRSESALQ